MKFRLKLNPIYKKEMKQSVRSIKLPLFLVLFNSILAIISLIAFYVTNEQVRLSGNIDYRSNIYLYIFMISRICPACLYYSGNVLRSYIRRERGGRRLIFF